MAASRFASGFTPVAGKERAANSFRVSCDPSPELHPIEEETSDKWAFSCNWPVGTKVSKLINNTVLKRNKYGAVKIGTAFLFGYVAEYVMLTDVVFDNKNGPQNMKPVQYAACRVRYYDPRSQKVTTELVDLDTRSSFKYGGPKEHWVSTGMTITDEDFTKMVPRNKKAEKTSEEKAEKKNKKRSSSTKRSMV